MEEERSSDVRVLEFDDYDEVLVEEVASQKTTRSDDAGIAVYWWDNPIQQKLTEQWSVQDNLKSHSIKYTNKILRIQWTSLN